MKKQLNKKIKFTLALIILLTLYVFISSYSYANKISNSLSNSVFRLHIIANSDSLEDQNLKFLIRDKIVEYMNNLCKNSCSKEETIALVSDHINDFQNIANVVIKENGFDYNAKAEIGNFDFPTKKYQDISFPAGEYDALRINIGNSNGQNWWCVLYPSLCFIDKNSPSVPEESKELLQNTLSDEEYKIISNKESMPINLKFKFIEFFARNKIVNYSSTK